MALQDVLALAKQGNVQAIDLLLNQMLQSKGVMARTVLKDQRLHLLLESERPLNQASLVPTIHRMIARLDAEEIKHLTVYGRQTGQQSQSWSQVIDLTLPFQETSLIAGNPTDDVEKMASTTQAVTTSDQTLPIFAPPPPPPRDRRNNFSPRSGSSANTNVNSRSDQTQKPFRDMSTMPNAQPPDRSVTPDSSDLTDETLSPTDDNQPAITVSQGSSGELSLLRYVAIAGITVLLGGIVWFQGRMIGQQENKVIEQARSATEGVGNPDQAKSLAKLKADQENLKVAINELKAVPNLPLFSGSKSQALAPTLEAKLQSVQQRAQKEEDAAQRLEKAQQLAKQAIAAVKAESSLSGLKQAEKFWQQAIDELVAIPDQTLVSDVAQATLINYQNNLAEIRKQVDLAQKPIPQRRKR